MRKPKNWLKVNSPRNSTCSANLHDLDFQNWWFDNGYIHVEDKRYAKDEAVSWRVFPKTNKRGVRIGVIENELYWIIPCVSPKPRKQPIV